MSGYDGTTYRLEDGVSLLRDGAEGFFSHVGGYDALGPERRSLAVDRVRDIVIDHPAATLALIAGVAGLAGVFLRRLGQVGRLVDKENGRA